MKLSILTPTLLFLFHNQVVAADIFLDQNGRIISSEQFSPEVLRQIQQTTGHGNEEAATTESRRYSLGLTGIHLGGLTGLTALGKLQINTGLPIMPYIDGGIGLSGGRYGIGAMWVFEDGMRYDLSYHGFSVVRHDIHSGISARLAMIHRWNDDSDRRDAWYGKDVPNDRYLGGEIDIIIKGICLTPGIYRALDTGEHYGAVSYGIGF